jgi:hypothetical protein
MTQNLNSCKVFGNAKILPDPKKFRTEPSSGKVMLLMFFDSEGIIPQQWLHRKQTICGVYKYILFHDVLNAEVI